VLTELQKLAHEKMKTLLRTRTLRGFPMNVPFTDVDEILTKVSGLVRSAECNNILEWIPMLRAD
jgi:hypothetical protein